MATNQCRKYRFMCNWRLLLWGGSAALLALPWVAMRFTSEVNWTAFDFLVFALLLVWACGGVELAMRTCHGATARTLAVSAVMAGAVLVWAVLAVG